MTASLQADMLQAGTVPALCRAVGLPGGGPLAAAAACVLSEALHDTGVALQVGTDAGWELQWELQPVENA